MGWKKPPTKIGEGKEIALSKIKGEREFFCPLKGILKVQKLEFHLVGGMVFRKLKEKWKKRINRMFLEHCSLGLEISLNGKEVMEEIANHYGYKLKIVSPPLFDDGEEVSGLCDHKQKVITLASPLLFWHELGHVVINKFLGYYIILISIALSAISILNIIFWWSSTLSLLTLAISISIWVTVGFLTREFAADIFGVYLAKRWLNQKITIKAILDTIK